MLALHQPSAVPLSTWGSRILFVDDDSLVLSTLRRLLARMRPEWEMEFVSSGLEALERLAGGSFSVVVTDLDMPWMNGLELLERVTAQHPSVVRVIYSAMAREVAPTQLHALADLTLEKPADAFTLLNTLETAKTSAKRREAGAQ